MTIDEARRQTIELLAKFGLADWKFELTDVKRAYGRCHYRLKQIQINGLWLLRPETQDHDVVDTIRHEVAHALTPGAKHGWQWKVKAMELGAAPKSCANRGIITEGIYQATCKCPGQVFHAHRKMTRGKFCRRCRTPLVYLDTSGKVVEKAAPRRRRPRYDLNPFGYY